MKIAIITQPLESNYGGLLQNFALQQTLVNLGHSPITFDQVGWLPPFSVKIKMVIKRWFSPDSSFQTFVKKHIQTTSKATSIEAFRKLDNKYAPKSYIVGSDQVWRPKYNLFLDASFLTFTQKKKIAYAASFGVDNWEYTKEQTQKYAIASQQFSAISVREDSAVSLCKEHFGVNAKLVLDPTLLLKAEDYDVLIDNAQFKENHVFTYILDSEKWKSYIVNDICDKFNTKEIAGKYNSKGELSHVLSVEQWLCGLKKSRFVVCDSFHGTAFSIIMHRPFLVLANPTRGNTRIQSLLQSLGLENRMITAAESFSMNNLLPINWNEVDKKLNEQRAISIDFLKHALANE